MSTVRPSSPVLEGAHKKHRARKAHNRNTGQQCMIGICTWTAMHHLWGVSACSAGAIMASRLFRIIWVCWQPRPDSFIGLLAAAYQKPAIGR